MIDDLVELAVAAAVDVEIEKAAKRHRWARVVRAVIALTFVVLLVGAVFITFKYS